MWGDTHRNGAMTNVWLDGVVMTYLPASRARGAITIIIIITMEVIIIKVRNARAIRWVLRGRSGWGVGRRLFLMCLLLSIVVCSWGLNRFCMFWMRLGTCSSIALFSLLFFSFLFYFFFFFSLLMVFPFWLFISLTSNSFLFFSSHYGFFTLITLYSLLYTPLSTSA